MSRECYSYLSNVDCNGDNVSIIKWTPSHNGNIISKEGLATTISSFQLVQIAIDIGVQPKSTVIPDAEIDNLFIQHYAKFDVNAVSRLFKCFCICYTKMELIQAIKDRNVVMDNTY